MNLTVDVAVAGQKGHLNMSLLLLLIRAKGTHDYVTAADVSGQKGHMNMSLLLLLFKAK